MGDPFSELLALLVRGGFSQSRSHFLCLGDFLNLVVTTSKDQGRTFYHDFLILVRLLKITDELFEINIDYF